MPRVTVKVRNTDGLRAALQAKDRRVKDAVLDIVAESADRAFNIAQDLCPRDTGFMADKMRLEFTREGYNYAIGWHAADFLGETRRGALPVPFYPPYVVFGTSEQAGRDPLTPAIEEERPRALAAMRRALHA